MVAVKAFSKEKQFAGEKGRDSLENEIKLMRRLSHRNIMRLEGVYETDNSIYVILEYLEGAQLNDLLKVTPTTCRLPANWSPMRQRPSWRDF